MAWLARCFVMSLPLAAAGCPAPDGNDATGDTDDPTNATDGQTSATDGQTSATGGQVPATDGTTATHGNDTDGSDTEGSDTDAPTTGTDGGETDGSGFPEACAMPDPAVDAAFTVDLGDWPVEDETLIQLDEVPCTITDVASAEGVATTLECEGMESASHTLEIEISATEAGDPVWANGDEVLLTYHFRRDWELRTGDYRWLTMRSAVDQLLLVAVDSDDLTGEAGDHFLGPPPSGVVPLEVELDEGACGYEPLDELVVPHAVTFRHGDDALALIGGQRGTLESGDLRWAIDLAAAEIGHCCHSLRHYELLLRAI